MDRWPCSWWSRHRWPRRRFRYRRCRPWRRLGDRRCRPRRRFALGRFRARWAGSTYPPSVIVVPQHRVIERVITVPVADPDRDAITGRKGETCRAEPQRKDCTFDTFGDHLRLSLLQGPERRENGVQVIDIGRIGTIAQDRHNNRHTTVRQVDYCGRKVDAAPVTGAGAPDHSRG